MKHFFLLFYFIKKKKFLNIFKCKFFILFDYFDDAHFDD